MSYVLGILTVMVMENSPIYQNIVLRCAKRRGIRVFLADTVRRARALLEHTDMSFDAIMLGHVDDLAGDIDSSTLTSVSGLRVIQIRPVNGAVHTTSVDVSCIDMAFEELTSHAEIPPKVASL